MNNEEYDENNNNDVGGEEYYDNYNFEPIWVRALYDYDAADDTEISFKENDVICITQDFEDGWWNGDLNGNVGRVPANYFEYLNQDQTGDYQQDNYDDAQDQQQQQYYEGEDGQLYYTGEDGQQYYYDGGQEQQQQQYDGGDYDQQNQQEGYGDDGDDEEGGNIGSGGVKKIDEARKELLRQKREVYKKEMKDLQDNLKNQNDCKDRLGTSVESLEKKRDELEDHIRLLKLLKFINLEIIKTEIDIDVDSDSSTTSRQTGIAITQDLKSIRTLLGIKSSTSSSSSSSSSSAVDAPKKQFDLKLEDIEKKVINNLNLLDSCDNLKKSLLLSLQLFQTTYLNGNGIPPPSPTRIKSIPTNSTNIQQQQQQQQQPPLPPSSSSNTNTSNNFYVSTSSTPSNAFFSAPSTPLSDKDKRKSVKEAKKEEKKLEKELKKEEKKEEKKLEKKVSK